ncbi:Putative glycyl-tRNA synthetase [Taphrina deformans PYCC 5710]|uniref:glycine--tRNA ligase n=1 Tax=Taphrina deformans (strain PYCC 5710 / ATCC 11124 / CBS 356.35 / IMI 108563 / JCM 9778 / NBRC 8474) TaxID=1097556 RepID=R4XFL5_TAPDE|nr:Putative glycyl-tRNA synthetase [Taphrina deformans PYCC 5710]|eukprot:CCG83277.1 Putative glycyl-tRNA synthetase [Taphrina deformans PYCC 5710]
MLIGLRVFNHNISKEALRNFSFGKQLSCGIKTMASRPAVSGQFERAQIEDVIKKRFFYGPAFDIYGAVSGLYDYGPTGCALQANIIDIWRKHFIINDSMLEVDTTCLTPAEVLKTSGHVDKFADWMSKDPVSGEIFRADHLVEEVIEARLKGHNEAIGKAASNEEESDDKKKRKKKVKQITAIKLDDAAVQEYEEILAKIDGYSGPELGELIEKYDIRNPGNDGKLNPPIQFNLMFDTQIGPTGQFKAYLRPETAQGQFLNFSKLLEFNNARMPFASASIGKSFRNEIAPRSGLLRVREFLMAEVEYFVDPLKKDHERFFEVEDVKLRFLSKDIQLAGKTTIVEQSIGEAVTSGMVDNQTLGYYLARIFLFLMKIGIDPRRLRFRQHMSTEMAHYACDCWDAEIETSYGWIECVGCADRSAYDLTVHSKKTGHPLIVREQLKEPIVEQKWIPTIERKAFGMKFKKDAKTLEAAIEDLSMEDKAQAAKDKVIKVNGFEVPEELVKLELKEVRSNIRDYTPNVIEPSFGIGRILYAVLEHSFWIRPESTERGVLSFPPSIAPTSVLLVPLSSNPDLLRLVPALSSKLRALEISNKVDDSSAAIGKRYARNDELGTPFGITIDFQTTTDGSLTLRERDSTKQIRASEAEILDVLGKLTRSQIEWSAVLAQYGEFTSQEA